MILGRPAETNLGLAVQFSVFIKNRKGQHRKIIFVADFQGLFSPPMTENDEAKPAISPSLA
jgi:hypothetical protein